MDTVNKEWNIKVVFITFYKFSVTEWIGALIVGIFIIVFFLGPLILSLMNSR